MRPFSGILFVRQFVLSLSVLFALGGCATQRIESPIGSPLPDFVLIGEVHDHPLQHQMRERWLEKLARDTRFVLAMEQLDADQQAALDAARGRGVSPRGLAEAAGFAFKGWDWNFYEPYLSIALRNDLPIVASNLSNADTRQIARGTRPFPPAARPADWGNRDDASQRAQIEQGHCGMLPPAAVAAMAKAQLARDAKIAQTLVHARQTTGLPVVLLAGNGHVRRDTGVPRHLRQLMPGASILSIGLIEESDPARNSVNDELKAAFDRVVFTPVHPRPDPCEAFKAHLRNKPQSQK